MDHDNLFARLKYVRDAVAAYFGVDDHESVVSWAYATDTADPKFGPGVVIEWED
jgi:hypothetical protein